MSKNVKTYMLLALVLFVWGIIGFKMIKALSPDREPIQTVRPVTPYAQSVGKRDTFRLLPDYRDPFLGTVIAPKRNLAPKASQNKVVPEKNIHYSGMVRGSGSGNLQFFVTIDGKQYIMSKNQKINGVSILSGDGESIRVRYDGAFRSIKRSQ